MEQTMRSNKDAPEFHTSPWPATWDLCRPEHSPLGTTANENPNQADLVTPLSRFAQSLPTGCITIIVAGSPCQQLTFAGRYRGQQGLRLLLRTYGGLDPTRT